MTEPTRVTIPNSGSWPDRFAQRVVLVSGAAGGLGAAAVQRLRTEGAIVVASDVAVPGESINDDLTVNLDVSDPKRWAAVVAEILERFGRLDGALFCHGIQGPEMPVDEVEPGGWERTLDINLNGCFYGLREIVPAMRDRGYGRIVMLSSIAGREGNENMTAYSVSKAGMIALAKSVAKETARHGISVNCVAPSQFETRLMQDLSPERNALLLARVPMGRIGYPEEFASLAAWLLSPEASYMTGQTLDLSGGRNTA